jgi:hypothetical protein
MITMKSKIRSGIVGLLLLMLITGVVVPAIGTADDSVGKLHLAQIFSMKPVSAHGTGLSGGNDGKSDGRSGGTGNGNLDGLLNRAGGFPSIGSGPGSGGGGGGGNSYTHGPAAPDKGYPGTTTGPGGIKDTGNVSTGPVIPQTPAKPIAVPEFPDLFMPVAGLIGLVGLVFRMRE